MTCPAIEKCDLASVKRVEARKYGAGATIRGERKFLMLCIKDELGCNHLSLGLTDLAPLLEMVFRVIGSLPNINGR